MSCRALRLLFACFLYHSYLKRRPDLPVAAHAEFATSAISEVVAEAAVAAADAAVAAADAALAAAALPTELPQQQQDQGEQSVEELLLNLKHADCATAATSSSSAQNSSVDRAVKQQKSKRKRSKAPTANAELPLATNWLGWSMSVSTKRQRAKYGV
jgi:Mg-chelatase subunit ChlI